MPIKKGNISCMALDNKQDITEPVLVFKISVVCSKDLRQYDGSQMIAIR